MPKPKADSRPGAKPPRGARPDPSPGPPRHPQLQLADWPAQLQRAGAGTPPHALHAQDALLLAWLALEGPCTRERLAGLLWPHSPPAVARNALRQRLFKLHKLEPALLQGSASLGLAPAVQHDLNGASTLLGALQAEGDGELATWLSHKRSAAGAQRAQALQTAAEEAEAKGELDQALVMAQSLLQQQPLSEAAHRRVMRLHYLRADRAAALLAFDACEQMLKHEVGARPSVQTLELLQLIEQSTAAPAWVPSPTAAPSPGAPPALSAGTPGATPAALPARAKAHSVPAAIVRPPRLVGRDEELAALQAALREGRLVLLLGEAGVGKSRLLTQACGAEWLLVHGRPGDSLAPYASAARWLRALLTRCGLKPSPAQLAALAPMLPEYQQPGRLSPNPQDIAAAVQALLHAAATQLHGHVLDDLHFADEASLALWQSLLAGPRQAEEHSPAPAPRESAAKAAKAAKGALSVAAASAPALRWCLAMRPGGAAAATDSLVQAVHAARPCLSLRLNPLSREALAEFVNSLQLPGLDGSAVSEALHARTGGNPLFALETLKLAWQEGLIGAVRAAAAPPPALPRPQTLTQLVAQQLARLSSAALMLARVAAVAGVDFKLELASAVLEQHPLALADAWAELEAQQVLREAQFVHDLIHDAVLQGVPAVIARHLHARVAEYLQTAQGEPARVAAHWEAAGQRAKALPALLAAAQRAQAALRGSESIALMLRAADIAQAHGDSTAAFDAVRGAVQTHMYTLRESAGLPLLARLDALASTPLQRAQAAAQRAWYSTLLGDWEQAAREGELALALAQRCADAALLASVQQRLGTTLALLGRFEQALPHMQAAQPWIDAEADRATQAEFHGNFATLLDNLGEPLKARAEHERALSHTHGPSEQAHRTTQLANHALSLLEAGDVAAGMLQAQAAQQIISAFDLDSSSAGFVALLHAQALRCWGHFDEARHWLDRAEGIMQRRNASRVFLQQAALWLDIGQFARAAQAFAAAGAGGLAPRYEVRRLVWMARLAFWQGQRSAADLLAQAEAALPSSGWPELAWMIQIERAAQGLPVNAGAAAAANAQALRAIARQAQARGLLGSVLAALIRLAHTAPDVPQRASAAREALALAGASAQVQVAATGIAAPELYWHAAQALHEAGDHAVAQAATAQGRAWLEAASARLEPAFLHGLRYLHPVHRALLAG
jgi:DNA-binding SARP family transcriptional activator